MHPTAAATRRTSTAAVFPAWVHHRVPCARPPASRPSLVAAAGAAAAMSGSGHKHSRTSFEFVNGRGQRLQGVEYVPAAGGAQQFATLVWHHGVCEHCERYVPVFEYLAASGVAVYSFDVHGHGKSEPHAADERGLIRDFNHLIDDLYTFVAAVEERTGRRLPADSTFLGGQSMGGLVAALAALRCQERWAGLIVFSGAMGVVWTPVLRVQALLGNVISSLIPKVQIVPAVNPDNLHPDPAVVASFRADPLVFKGDLRARTGNELLKAIRHLERHRGELALPLYVVHGTKDAVTDVNAVAAFVGGVAASDTTFNRVEGGYHEMLMGDERLGSADGIVAWVRPRVGPAAVWQQATQQQQQAAAEMGGVLAEGPAGAPRL